ncbi:PH, RCC1 and FYVE domains-containing protein 1 isoform X1 [Typha angustifolia]|uniref:PH, RCC1 and FYVE domains-containing protein 1 isoform X1 n=1 Tax=Typha angustifolia TaxID=59011 RepID=UPI003C2B8378
MADLDGYGVSPDRDIDKGESSLIWSTGGERSLKLASVSGIIPSQRTISKDKFEAEVLFGGLNAFISSNECSRSKIDGWSDGGLYFEDTRDLISKSPSESSISTLLSVSSPDSNLKPVTLPVISSSENLVNVERSDVTNMHVKGTSSDVFRVSISSAPSTSSHGSAQDDCDSLGDVYVWGEVICDNYARSGADKIISSSSGRADFLLPKPLDSNLVLDVHHLACGVRHAALVTKHGEVFTWGEESGGRLGHGVGTDIVHPHLVESLAICNAEFVACGEFHTCAVSMSGELYTWGDGTHNVGLLGHGNNVSHWIPKRVSGPLDGLQVAYVTCGTWHTAVITSAGQLFTFGDGTFGVLGHGNRESISYPREVESLMGLKTIAVACGVWHTAAVVEVIVAQSSASVSSGKLFTWGDGDKYRLGHGDKDPRLKPTCVPSLIDYNFHKVACGHTLTIGLTTSGRVFTMGSTVYGQLGNHQSDGKIPCSVEDKLASESIVGVACGSYHVAVLTSRNEVFTWGKGANGRLGHGDLEDRKTPTLVEALRDRPVRHIACGANFTAAICQHKWVSGAEQSQCASCRQAFGFTRKRHNCYNCGLVHCHSCSSRKALRAALSPNPGKPYRVCDSCYAKLNKVSDSGGMNNKRNVVARLSGESKDRFDKADTRAAKAILPSNFDMIKNLDTKAAKQGRKTDSFSFIRTPQIGSLIQLKDIALSGGIDMNKAVPRAVRTSLVQSVNSSRAVSPFSRRPSPPRSATPIPTTYGLSFSKNVADNLKKSNELLKQEVQKLRAQVDNLKQRCDFQELELQKSAKRAQEAIALAAEESAKSKAAKEVIKSLTAQLKDMAERLPDGVYEGGEMKPVLLPNGTELHANQSNMRVMHQSRNDSYNISNTTNTVRTTHTNGISGENHIPAGREINEMNTHFQNHRLVIPHETEEHISRRPPNGCEEMPTSTSRTHDNVSKESEPLQDSENGFKSRSTMSTSIQVEAEWIEQYEPGVYITLMALRDGTRELKRVRFSRRKFGEHQAEAWWSENREKVYERYNVHASDRASSAASTQSARRSEEDFLHPSKV